MLGRILRLRGRDTVVYRSDYFIAFVLIVFRKAVYATWERSQQQPRKLTGCRRRKKEKCHA